MAVKGGIITLDFFINCNPLKIAMCCFNHGRTWFKSLQIHTACYTVLNWIVISWIMFWGWSFKLSILQGTCSIKAGPCYPLKGASTPSSQGLQPQQPPAVLSAHQGYFHLCGWAGLTSSFAWNALLQVSVIPSLLPGALVCTLLSGFIFLHGTYHYLKYFRY